MAFTVEDFEDLQRLLAEHPEWCAQLRPLILGDEFLQVPARLNVIDERLERISSTLEEQAQRRAGYNALAFVGAYGASEAAQRLAGDLNVVLDLRRQSA